VHSRRRHSTYAGASAQYESRYRLELEARLPALIRNADVVAEKEVPMGFRTDLHLQVDGSIWACASLGEALLDEAGGVQQEVRVWMVEVAVRR
jgi:hypothetical protein